MPIDPVCGMTVDPATASGSYDYQGTSYYFCNPSCLTRFKATPESFLEPRATEAAPVSSDALYTCPMHPEIVQHGPGACPKCGMALEPMTISADDGPNPELVDMTRRFWMRRGSGRRCSSSRWPTCSACFAAGTRPCFWGAPCRRASDDRDQLDRSHLLDAGRALGRPAVLRARVGVDQDPQPNMFTLIALGIGTAWLFSAAATLAPQLFPAGFRRARRRRDLLRYGGRHHRARAARSGSRAAGAGPYRSCHPAAARPRTANGAHHPQWPGARRAGRAHPPGRSPARPAGGEDSDRWPRRRGTQRGRRIDAHGRAAAGRQGAGTARHGRDDQRHGELRHARGARRERDRAGADRPDGGRGAAHARPDSAAGRCGVGLVRAGSRRGGDRGVRCLVCLSDPSRGSRSRCSVPSPSSSSPAPVRLGSPRRWRSWWARAGARPPAC